MAQKTARQQIADGELPKIPEKEFRYFQECADKVVQRHHMCGGCLKGQFYCDVFLKWRRQQIS